MKMNYEAEKERADRMREYFREDDESPEDLPVAWINPYADPYAPLDMHFQFQNPGNPNWLPLYTRPQDEKLRKLQRDFMDAWKLNPPRLDSELPPSKILIHNGQLAGSMRLQSLVLADGWYNIYPVKP